MSAEARQDSQQLTEEFHEQAQRRGAAGTMFGAQREGDALAEVAKLSTVVVATMQEAGPGQFHLKSAGTGFVVAESGQAGTPNRVVTARHEVADLAAAGQRNVVFDSHGRMIGQARMVDVPGIGDADVAVLAIDHFQPGREADWNAIPGLRLAMAPAGNSLSVLPFGTTPGPMQGSSGSPLLDGESGAVVGILVKGIPLLAADEEFEVGDVLATIREPSAALHTTRHAMTSVSSGIVQPLPPAILQALGRAGQEAHDGSLPTGADDQPMRSGLLAGYPDMAAVIAPVYYTAKRPSLRSRLHPGGTGE